MTNNGHPSNDQPNSGVSLPKPKRLDRPGRKIKLNEEMINQIRANIISGLNRRDATILAGVSERSIYLWLTHGRKVEHALETGTPESELSNKDLLCLQLLHAIRTAEPLQKRNLMLKIMNASDKPQHWTAAAWMLERKYPNEFGRMVKFEVNWQEEAKRKGIDMDNMFDEMVAKIMEKLENGTLDQAENAEFVDVGTG